MTKLALTQPEAVAYADAVKRLVRRVKAYGKRANLSPAQVSKKVFGHRDRLGALDRGKSFLLPDTYDEVCKKLDGYELALSEQEQAA